MKKTPSLAFCALFITAIANAAPCAVTSVSDGETLTVRCGDRGAERVKLYGVDAPKGNQSFAVRSRDALEALCGARPVVVHRTGRFAVRPTLAYVNCDGIDANRKMIEMGLAWVDRTHTDDPDLLELESLARERRAGLWADKKPVRPNDVERQAAEAKAKTEAAKTTEKP